MSIQQIIKKINKAFNHNQYENYIKYIRFPNYKNLQTDSKIEFDFPVTVLTGLNGSGKSSALHAIYGCPEGKSTADFWFTTNVDPISDTTEKPNCYIYGYNDGRNIVEVIKKRSGTAKGADYWETARPEKKYNMQTLRGGARNPPLPKNVIYLDFRAQLSAFDQFFYFGKFNSSTTIKSKQDKLRKASKFLKWAIDNDQVYHYYSMLNKLPINLTQGEVDTISQILDKRYDSCKLINHNLYGQDGLTVYFHTPNLKYSEAYAGRGEFAVVKLVHELHNAPNHSLVILDEPEVSLHPGAQKELRNYLLNISLEKKLQVVISTHSSAFVESLPDQAIKLFYQDPSGKFDIKNTCNYREAFQNIGVTIKESDKKIICVEDKTAARILDNIITHLGQDFKLMFKVKYYPGGADDIYKAAIGYSQEDEKHKFILLDGDKKKEFLNLSEVSNENWNSLDFWKQAVLELTDIQYNKLPFRFDSGTTNEAKCEIIRNYYNYLKSNLGFFPGNIPEDIIWDESYANSLLRVNGVALPSFTNNSKENIHTFARNFFGNADENNYNAAILLFIKNAITQSTEGVGEIILTLREFKNTAEPD